MDPITVKGIKIQTLSIDLANERKISGSYALVSSLDRVIAKQSFGGYSDMEIQISVQAQAALDAFLRAYKADVCNVLGLPTD